MLVADLHIHSRYARGTSSKLNITNLAKFAKLKGIDLLGVGDIFHEKWVSEAKSELKGDEVYEKDGVLFIAAGEVNTVWECCGKARKVHHLLLFPSLDSAMEFRRSIERFGSWEDGRPTIHMSAEELALKLYDFEKEAMIIPAHIWTPWFGVFGSKSGFESLEEAYGKAEKLVYGVETGLSSDPEMNWIVRELDSRAILSFSDAHSFWPHRLGRELTALEAEESYRSIKDAIEGNKVVFTVEVDPAYGKYHFDGHRKCGVAFSPDEAEKHGNICPVCGKPLTKGVLHRVYEIADREIGFKPANAKPFFKLLPLTEILAHVSNSQPTSKRVLDRYFKITSEIKELDVLLKLDEKDLRELLGDKAAELIVKMRRNELEVVPGYDGVYGRIGKTEKKEFSTLFDFE